MPPPVKVKAEELGIEVFQPEKINTRAARARVAEARPEAIVVVAFGQILRPLFLALAPQGCLNVHASLLPRHRGASPLNAQILHGDSEVGVTIMRMDEGLDTGPIGLMASLPGDPRETAGALHDRLAPLGGALIVEALDAMEQGSLEFRPQPEEGVTYAGLMKKSDGHLDFQRSAVELDRQIRGLHPWPGSFADLQSGDDLLRLGILEATVHDRSGTGDPGQVTLGDGGTFEVTCGEGVLEITRLKPPGRRPMPVRDFLNGARLAEHPFFVPADQES